MTEALEGKNGPKELMKGVLKEKEENMNQEGLGLPTPRHLSIHFESLETEVLKLSNRLLEKTTEHGKKE